MKLDYKKSLSFYYKTNFIASIFNCRFALKHEEEKRRNAVWLCEKIKEQLIEKEEYYNKEVEMKQQLDMCVRTLDMELKTVRNNLTKVN
jgi:serine/threonine protein phosphatase PrpC